MRKKGSQTKINCWNCKVVNNGNTLFDEEFKTLRDVAEELGMTYNQVVEISSGRKKKSNGKYDTQYEIEKIKKAEKLNKMDLELKEEDIEINPSMNGLSA
tara:strand:- start:217 stop:516 length:300 start_codon:yes stop_codon:yes gene_type:complete